MISFDEYEKCFDDYTASYDQNDGRIVLKILHTKAVTGVMETLCKLRRLPAHTRDLALLCALFHDLGRFEQLRQYDTFLDHRSLDHASLSCQVLKENGILDSLPQKDRERILTAIENHNKMEIDPAVLAAAKEGETETLELCRLIRDADKCDIFRVFATDDMTDAVGASEEAISRETITPEVMNALREHRSVDRKIRKSHLDHWIGFLCFLFDLNYPETMEIVKRKGDYRKPFDRTYFPDPETRALVNEALSIAEQYMASFGQTVPEPLQKFFGEHKKLALAFSGGTDSAYLLYAAKTCGCDVRAYYVHSPFQPEFELEDAKKLAALLDVPMTVLPLPVLEQKAVRENPADRCYHCKNAIFSAILSAAAADGYREIMDGTNASDDAGDRPGMRALQELEILSPLRLCRVTKLALREYSRNAGLFTWNKPAYACLATRIPTGTAIDGDILKKIERAEAGLMALGFSDFRVRVQKISSGKTGSSEQNRETPDGNPPDLETSVSWAAKIQVRESQFPLVCEKRREILSLLKTDFTQVHLDLEIRGM